MIPGIAYQIVRKVRKQKRKRSVNNAYGMQTDIWSYSPCSKKSFKEQKAESLKEQKQQKNSLNVNINVKQQSLRLRLLTAEREREREREREKEREREEGGRAGGSTYAQG